MNRIQNLIRKLSCTAMLLILGAFLLTVHPQMVSAEETNAPVIHWDTMKVSSSKVKADSSVTISVKITDDSGVDNVWIQSRADRIYAASNVTFYRGSDDVWYAKVPAEFYGRNAVFELNATDVWGNSADYYNTESPQVQAWFNSNYDGLDTADMSAWDFYVDPGTYAEETEGPEYVKGSIEADNYRPGLRDTVTVSLRLKDDSPVRVAYLTYGNNISVYTSEGHYNEDTGKWEFRCSADTIGNTEMMRLTAFDAWGNESGWYDSQSRYFELHDEPYSNADFAFIPVDLSGGNFTCGDSLEKDTEPPEILLDTISIDKKYVGKNAPTVLRFKMKEASPIYEMNIWVKGRNTSVWGMAVPCISGSFGYNEETGYYEIELSGNYYGAYQLDGIQVIDAWGNTTHLEDYAWRALSGYDPDPDTVDTDFSETNFYVGVFSRNEETFASNSTMDDSSRLNVSANIKEDVLNILREDGYTPLDAREVRVLGTLDMSTEKTLVALDAPEGFQDGDTLRIRHLLSNGTVQTEDAEVDHGMVTIEVSSFSPFMLEVSSDKNYNTVTVDNAEYQLTGSSTATLVKVTNKSLKKMEVPDYIRSRGKKYKVTAIADKAFRKCTKLTTLVIGNKVTTIGSQAFYGCTKLSKVTLGTGVKTIGSKAFYGCKALKYLYIKSTKLTYSGTGSSAFAKTYSSMTVKASSKKLTSYRKLLLARGLSKKAKFKKL